jgi:dGTP triphosphohydrolase
MHRLREFMFERVYLAGHAHDEHRRAHDAIEKIVAHLVERGDSPDEIVEYVAGMTDRFALEYAAKL